MSWESAIATGALIEVEYVDSGGVTHKMKTLIDYPYQAGYFTIYAPMQNAVAFPMQQGDHLHIFFMMDNADKTDKDIFKLKCYIDQRGFTNNIPVYKLQCVGEPEKQQRRGAFRLPILKDFAFRVMDEKPIHYMTSTNVSATGMKAVTTENLESGLPIVIEFDNDDETFTVNGRIITIHLLPDSFKNYELRIQFAELNSITAKKLNRFLYKKQSEIIQKTADSEEARLIRTYYQEEFDPKELVRKERMTILYLCIAFSFFMVFELIMFINAIPNGLRNFWTVIVQFNSQIVAWNYTYVSRASFFAIVSLILNGYAALLSTSQKGSIKWLFILPLLITFMISLYILTYTVTTYLTSPIVNFFQ